MRKHEKKQLDDNPVPDTRSSFLWIQRQADTTKIQDVNNNPFLSSIPNISRR